MYYDPSFGDRIQCSEQEKRQAEAVIPEVLDLAERARKLGLISLGHDTGRIADAFLREGVKLISRGYDPAVIEKILDIRISCRKASGADLLRFSIAKEGLLSILRSDPAALTEEILFSFLGTDRYEAYQRKKNEDFYQYTRNLGNSRKTALTQVGKWLISASDAEIGMLMKYIDWESLSILLKDETDYCLYRVYRNLSEDAGKMFRERLISAGTADPRNLVKAEARFSSVVNRISSGAAEVKG